jgi:hypothetical protein
LSLPICCTDAAISHVEAQVCIIQHTVTCIAHEEHAQLYEYIHKVMQITAHMVAYKTVKLWQIRETRTAGLVQIAVLSTPMEL